MLTNWAKTVRRLITGRYWKLVPRRHARRAESRRLVPTLRRLEDRTVPAVTSVFDTASSTLVVTADAADPIAVTVSGGKVLINGANPTSGALSASLVVQLDVRGVGAFDNAIDLSGVTSTDFTSLILTRVDGGGGNNSLKLNNADHAVTILSDNGGSDLQTGDYSTISSTQDAFSTFFVNTQAITAGSGSDTFTLTNGRKMAGTLDAGGGNDTLDLGDYTTAVTIKLAAGTATNIAGGIAGFENATGGSGADYLVGSAGANVLVGGAGNDTLIGLAGSDVMDGGTGDDTYFLTVGAGETDALTESSGTDVVRLDGNADVAATTVGVTIDLDDVNSQVVNGSGATAYRVVLGRNGSNGYEQYRGGSGNDTVSVDALTVSRTVDGGAGTNVLNVDAKGGQPVFGPGVISFVSPPALGDIYYSGFGNLNIGPVTGEVLINGSDADADSVTINATGPDAGSFTWSYGSFSTTVQMVSVTKFTFNSRGGADTLTVNSPSGGLFAPANSVIYSAGAGTDRLNLTGAGSVDGSTATYDPVAGTITTVKGGTQVVSFSELEQVADDARVASYSVLGTGGDDAVALSNGTLSGGSRLRVAVNTVAIELSNKENLRVLAGGGNDAVQANYTAIPAGMTTVAVDGGDGNDTFQVRSVAGPALSLAGGGGDDAYAVHSGTTPTGGNLDAINTTLNIDAGGGNNSLVVSDYTAAAGNTAAVIGGSSITGLAPAAINFAASGGGLALTVYGSNSAADTFTVNAPNAPLLLDGAGANDVFNVRALSQAGTIVGGAGNDAVAVGSTAGTDNNGNLDGITAPLTIALAGGANTFVISDYASGGNGGIVMTAPGGSGTITGLAPASITYSASGGSGTLTVRGSNTGDTFSIRGTPSNFTTTVQGNGGSDAVTVSSNGGGNGNLDGILGGLTVDLGTGGGSLSLVDFSGAANANVVVTSSQVTGLAPVTISYFAGAAGHSLSIVGSDGGADAFSVRSTSSQFTTNVSGAGGNDSAIVSSTGTADGHLDSIAGALNVDLGGGSGQSLIVSDKTAGAGNANVVLTNGSITGLAPAAIGYGASGGSGNLTVYGTALADSFNVRSTAGNFATDVQALGGADSFLVSSAGTAEGNVDGIAGALTIAAGGDAGDTATVSDRTSAGVWVSPPPGPTDPVTGSPPPTYVPVNGNVVVDAATIQGLAPATITYAGLNSLTVEGSDDFLSPEGFTVRSPAAAFTLLANAGNDTALVQSLAQAAVVNTGDGNDAVTVASAAGKLDTINGDLAVNLGAGSNSLLVDDTAEGATANSGVVLTASQITGFAGSANGRTISYSAAGGGNTLTLKGSDKLADTFKVQGTGAGFTTVVLGQGGADTALVSSDGTGVTGHVNDVAGTLDIQLGAGDGQVIKISDAGGAANPAAVVTNQSVTGLSAGTILYSVDPASADGSNVLEVYGSDAGADGVNVRSTSVEFNTGVFGNGGDDAITVNSEAPSLWGNLDGIAGALTVQGGAGSNSLTVSDQGASANNGAAVITATQITGFAGPGNGVAVTYGGISNLVVEGSNGHGETFTVQAPNAALTLNANGGNDTVLVQALTQNATVNGGGGDDAVTVASAAGRLDTINADLGVSLGSGNNSLLVDDTAEGTTANSAAALTASQLTGLAGSDNSRTISYSADGGANTLTVRGSNALADVVRVRGTAANFVTNVVTQGGVDTVAVSSDGTGVSGNVDAVAGTLNIDLGAGNGQALRVSDQSGAAGNAATLVAGQVSGLAPALINYTADPASAGNALEVYGSDLDDSFQVRSTSALFTTLVNGRAGNDAVYVNSNGSSLDGTLDAIAGGLSVQGGGGTDTLWVSDRAAPGGEGAAPVTASITAAQVLGLAGPTNNIAVSYGGIASLVVEGSDAGDLPEQFTVQSPGAVLTLNSNGGNDVVLVRSLTAAAAVNTGAGDDAVTVASTSNRLDQINGDLAVNLGDGSNSLAISDSGETVTANTAAVLTSSQVAGLAGSANARTISYSATGASTLTVTGSATLADVFSVRSTSATFATTVEGLGGDDAFHVHSAAAGAHTAGNLDGIAGALSVLGGGGSNSLTVSDYTAAAGNSGTINGSQVAGLAPVAIGYAGIGTLAVHGSNAAADTIDVASPSAALTLNTHAGADTVNVRGVAPALAAVVSTGEGDDAVNVGDAGNAVSLGAALTVDGGAGADALAFNDQGAAKADRTYAISNRTFSRTDAAQVTFSNAESLLLNAANGRSTVTVSAVVATMPVTINGGSDADTLFAPNAANVWALDATQAYNRVQVGTTADAIRFKGVEYANGGAFADTFYLVRPASPTDPAGRPTAGVVAISGGAGSDRLDFSAVAGAVKYTISAADAGATDNTMLQGFSSVENITAGAGDDVFKLASNGVGLSGTADGGGGANWLDYSGYTVGVAVALGEGTAVGTADNVGAIRNFSHVIGGAGNDTLEGNSANNVLVGLGGSDTLKGFDGRDLLIGGAGADILIGGRGEDILVGGGFSSDLETNTAKLTEVMGLWSNTGAGTGEFAVRRLAIQALPYWTPTDDSAADRMTGGTGDSADAEADWFVNFGGDILTDFLAGVDAKDR